MGRAERRKAERNKRIENRKGKVLLSRKEISEMKQKISNEAARYDVEILMTCFALAEHRLYGFGQKRILRSLRCKDELMGAILDDTATIDDYRRELNEKANVMVKFDE